MAERLIISAFAKRVGISPRAVQGHISRGNIPFELNESGHKVIDLEKGLEAMKLIDPSKSFSGRANQKENHPNSKPRSDEKPKKTSGQTFSEARAMREAYNAQIAKLNFDEKAGKLIDKNEVKALAFKVGREIRDSLMQIPEKLSPELAYETSEKEIAEILEVEIRQALSSLEKMRF